MEANLTQVAKLVEERGFKAGYNDDQFMARNVIKLLEEALELLYETPLPQTKHSEALMVKAHVFQIQVRDLFRDKNYWKEHEFLPMSDKGRAELADVQVVLSCIADAAGVDIIEEAVNKASNDVRRGTG